MKPKSASSETLLKLKNNSSAWSDFSDSDIEQMLRELPSAKTTTDPSELGIFVGEGLINVQPYKETRKDVPVGEAAKFLTSNRKDAKPIGPKKHTSVSRKKPLLESEQDLRVPKNENFEDSDTEGVIEASFELQAQDFVVFDKTPMLGKGIGTYCLTLAERQVAVQTVILYIPKLQCTQKRKIIH